MSKVPEEMFTIYGKMREGFSEEALKKAKDLGDNLE